MVIRAYDESYLSDGMINLGEAFDYAVNDCKIDADEFMSLFISTGISDVFGRANPKVIVGRSGTELVMEVLRKAKLEIALPDPSVSYDRSREYWAGWILAYYQWSTAKSFRFIHSHVSMKEIIKMYHPLHEAPEDKFVESLNAIIKRTRATTRLQLQRKMASLSQRELSELSGVNIRTLQQYELGTKDINKASVQTIISMARVLGCNIEDILE